jgi:hypothetical protein
MADVAKRLIPLVQLISASPLVAPMAASPIGAAALMGSDESDAWEWPRQMYNFGR